MSDEYDVSVRGREVPRHFSLTVSVQAAAAIRRVMSDFREHCMADPGWYGLREDEDEALEKLVAALEPRDGGEEATVA